MKTRRKKEINIRILMVLPAHDHLGNTGRKTGFWLEEFAAPYFVFRDAGVQLTLASPKGGQPPNRSRCEAGLKGDSPPDAYAQTLCSKSYYRRYALEVFRLRM